VGGGEAEPFIEAVGGGAGLVGGQLHQRALPSPGFIDSPGEQDGTEATVTVGLIDPDGLDLCPQGTTAGQAGKEGKLHRGHDVMAGLRHYQQVRRVAVDGLEGRLVGGQVLGAAHAVSRSTKLVSGKQAHDRGNITDPGAPQNDTGRTQVNRFQDLHLPSLHRGRKTRHGGSGMTEKWQLWQDGSGINGYYAFVLQGNQQNSGIVHILSALRILVGRGDIPADTSVTDLQFGWEICSTGNVPLHFTVDNYAVWTGLR
jgi:hypothetical protein